MNVPIGISFQGTPHSKAVEEAVIKHADRLKRTRADLMRYRVGPAVGAKHQHQGKPFNVNVHVFTPHQAHVSSDTSNENPYVTLHEVLSYVERMLLKVGSKRPSQS